VFGLKNAGAAVLLTALSAAAAGCTSGAGAIEAGQELDTPRPATTTQGGVTYHVRLIPPAAAVLDATDPTVIDVYVFQTADSKYPACAQLSTSARAVDQNAQSVLIATFGYTTRPTTTRPCLYASSFGSPLFVARPVQLNELLGARRLVDVKTGHVIGIADGQPPPAPSYLPPGFHSSFSQPFNASSGFFGVRQYRRGHDVIEVHVLSATTWHQQGEVVGHAQIGGQPATITDDSHERCLTWTDHRHLIRQVCSLPSSSSFLSQGELTRIASTIGS
jgi:hypothetical protein